MRRGKSATGVGGGLGIRPTILVGCCKTQEGGREKGSGNGGFSDEARLREGGRDGVHLFDGLSAAAGDFEFEIVEALVHGPAVVGFEGWLQQEGQVAQEWFFGAEFPIEGDIDKVAVWHDGPDAATDEITRGRHDDVEGFAGIDGFGIPFEGVGQPAFGLQMEFTAFAGGVAFFRFLDG